MDTNIDMIDAINQIKQHYSPKIASFINFQGAQSEIISKLMQMRDEKHSTGIVFDETELDAARDYQKQLFDKIARLRGLQKQDIQNVLGDKSLVLAGRLDSVDFGDKNVLRIDNHYLDVVLEAFIGMDVIITIQVKIGD